MAEQIGAHILAHIRVRLPAHTADGLCVKGIDALRMHR